MHTQKDQFLSVPEVRTQKEAALSADFRKDFDWLCVQGREEDHPHRPLLVQCASAVKYGLEIIGIAVVDADIPVAMMLRAV